MSTMFAICECVTVSVGSDDTGRATAITGEQTQVEVMAAAMSPHRQRTCLIACADVHSLHDIRSCLSQQCNWNVGGATSTKSLKRWGNRICMETHCRSWQGDIERYFSCGLQHCS